MNTGEVIGAVIVALIQCAIVMGLISLTFSGGMGSIFGLIGLYYVIKGDVK